MRNIHLDNFIGQKNVVNTLKVLAKSAKMRMVSMPHIMLYGASGCGKTQLAMSLAQYYGSKIQIVNAASIKSIDDLAKFILKLNEDDILFIDEIHRLNKKTQESLFHVLEDFRLDLANRDNIVSYKLDSFTCVAATTDFGLLLKPLRDRFQQKLELQIYNDTDMLEIAKLYVGQNKLKITKEGAELVIRASRGTPRICKSNIEWVRDYCLVNNVDIANKDIVNQALMMQGYDEHGMSEMDRRYIDFLKTSNTPVGLETISLAINIDINTISNVIEPWLILNKIIIKGPKGRYLVRKSA